MSEIPAHAQVLPVACILDAPTLKALVDVLVTRHGTLGQGFPTRLPVCGSVESLSRFYRSLLPLLYTRIRSVRNYCTGRPGCCRSIARECRIDECFQSRRFNTILYPDGRVGATGNTCSGILHSRRQAGPAAAKVVCDTCAVVSYILYSTKNRSDRQYLRRDSILPQTGRPGC